METLKKKLTSRKLWAMIAGVVSGLAMAFGLDESIVTSTAGAVMSAASIIVYIVTEGKIDAVAVKNTVEQVQDVVSKLDTGEQPVTAEQAVTEDWK